MPEQEAEGSEAELDDIANQLHALRKAEEKLARDLQACIDATNRLLARIGKATELHGGGAPNEASSQR